MNHTVEVEGVWKRFQIHQLRSLTRRIRESMNLLRTWRSNGGRSTNKQDFWALRDISFQVKAGESLGVIGPNGAGKTTLLRLLSGITRPTRGSIRVKGRIGALINVGAGFHAELTGRENVYLNGAIMGMSRAEIRSKFDRIVDFAEVGEFLDTPLKRYSAGMAVRLGFSVAAHLDPDVLLVDEVLSVGDQLFRQKSLQRMHELFRSGVTILFVSHNLGAVRGLCDHAVLLESGRVLRAGASDEVVDFYLNETFVEYARRRAATLPGQELDAQDKILVKGIRFLDGGGNPLEFLQTDEDGIIRIELEALHDVPRLGIRLSVRDSEMNPLFSISAGEEQMAASKGRLEVDFHVRRFPLLRGEYPASVKVTADDRAYARPISEIRVQTPTRSGGAKLHQAFLGGNKLFVDVHRVEARAVDEPGRKE